MNFAHDRAEDWAWLRDWQPSVVRLMLPGSHTDPNSVDVNRIRRVHETVPEAQIILRVWDVDDRNGEAHRAMAANPVAEAGKQLDWWARVFDRVTVPRGRLIAGLNNEVNPHQMGAALYAYTETACGLGTQRELRLGAGVFSVGNPGKPGEGPFDMAYFARLEDVLLSGDHVWIVHEYMQPEGMYAVWTDDEGHERHDFGNLINRHTHWPSKRVKQIIGEWGIDGLLFGRHPHPQYGNSGWKHYPELWTPERYADEYVACCKVADPTVIAICPFMSDNPDQTGKWWSFDVLPAYGELLKRKALCEIEVQPSTPSTVYIPVVSTPGQEKPMSQNWERAIAWILAREGGFQADPSDHGNYYQGRLIGTKFGISAAAWAHLYDIPNLTIEQAKNIYFQHYWLASGADKYDWPLCLAHFDTAVNAGIGRAQEMMGKSGGDFLIYMGHLISWYTRIPNFEDFGRAWIRRRAELLLEASK